MSHIVTYEQVLSSSRLVGMYSRCLHTRRFSPCMYGLPPKKSLSPDISDLIPQRDQAQ